MKEATWQVGPVEIITTSGPQVIAGWVNGKFGLDFRAMLTDDEEWDGGWVLTHLPTGMVVRRIFANLQTAQAYAGEIAAHGDWDFTEATPDRMKALSPVIAAAKAKFPNVSLVARVFGEIAPRQALPASEEAGA